MIGKGRLVLVFVLIFVPAIVWVTLHWSTNKQGTQVSEFPTESELRSLVTNNGADISTPRLVDMLHSEEPLTRLKVMHVLVRRSDSAAVELLMRVAKTDPVVDVRGSALEVLGALGDDRAVPVYFSALSRGGLEGRMAEIAFRKVRDEAAWKQLLEIYLTDSNPVARQGALVVLETISSFGMRPFCRRLGSLKLSESSVLFHLVERLKVVSKDSLIDLVSDDDAEVRLGAMMLLSKFPTPKAASILAEQLVSGSSAHRLVAVTALAGAPSLEAGIALRGTLVDKDEAVVAYAVAALKALNLLNSTDVANLLAHESDNVRIVAASASENLSFQDSVVLIEPLLADKSLFVRRAAAHVFARHGKKGNDLLLHRLDSATVTDRGIILGAFVNTHDQRAIAALGEGLMAEDAGVRLASQVALSSCGERGFSWLAKAVTHSRTETREAAVVILSDIEGLVASRLLLKVVRSEPHAWLRAQAIDELGKRRFPEALFALKDALYSKDDDVGESAAHALGWFEDEGEEALQAALASENHAFRMRAAKVLTLRGNDDAVRVLREVASGSYAGTDQLVAIQTLARGGDSDALSRLVEMMGSEDVRVRLQARTALAGVSRYAPPRLIDSLGSVNPHIRAGAAHLMGFFNVTSARDELARLTEDNNEEVRKAAAYALQVLH